MLGKCSVPELDPLLTSRDFQLLIYLQLFLTGKPGRGPHAVSESHKHPPDLAHMAALKSPSIFDMERCVKSNFLRFTCIPLERTQPSIGTTHRALLFDWEVL